MSRGDRAYGKAGVRLSATGRSRGTKSESRGLGTGKRERETVRVRRKVDIRVPLPRRISACAFDIPDTQLHKPVIRSVQTAKRLAQSVPPRLSTDSLFLGGMSSWTIGRKQVKSSGLLNCRRMMSSVPGEPVYIYPMNNRALRLATDVQPTPHRSAH